MTRIFIVCGIIFLLFACKKDKLVGELAVFEGRWKMEWYVKERYYPSIQDSAYDTITILTDSYEMLFEKKGKVRFIKNGEEVEKHRTIVEFLKEPSLVNYDIPNSRLFSISLDNNSETPLNGYILDNQMFSANKTFPFTYHDEGAAKVSYRCYFKKQ